MKRHTNEAARRQNIAAMGIDPAPPAATLRITPITGNDIFGSRTQASAPTVTPPIIDEDIGRSDNFTTPSRSAAPLPRSIPQYSIPDNDFPPDSTRHEHNPPQFSDPPNCYPSMEASNTEEDGDEDKTEDRGHVQGDDEPHPEGFMDLEYLGQGSCCLPDYIISATDDRT